MRVETSDTYPHDFDLFPHQTVHRNIDFGLRIKNTSDAEMHRIVYSHLKTLSLEVLAEREPTGLRQHSSFDMCWAAYKCGRNIGTFL